MRLLATAAALLTVSCDGLLLRTGAESKLSDSRRSVWVHAFARSGSSTILSLVSENEGQFDQNTNKTLSRAFTLFEPCHTEDELEPQLATKGCVGMLQSLSRCDFSGIKKLHGWHDIHSKKRGVDDYAPELASSACSGADVLAFKTISKAYEKFVIKDKALGLLEKEPNLYMVDVIRDPRSIYSSWMTTWPFNDTNLGGLGRDVTALLDICDSFAGNLDVHHPRIHRLKFEDLVKSPWNVTKDTYRALGMQFGSAQEEWVKKTFNAKDCPGVDQWIAAYSDCHTQSDQSLERWRTVLRDEEKIAFAMHPGCQKVAHAYGYAIE